MLDQTKETAAEVLAKIKVYDFLIRSLTETHKDQEKEVSTRIKNISAQKFKLIDELFRLIK